MTAATEPVSRTERSRGIRTQLLALLLPCLAILLAIDSWSDYIDRVHTVDAAYDEALLEPLSALNDAVEVNENGELDLTYALPVQAMFESLLSRHKHLHVSLEPLGADAGGPGRERQLLGTADLPQPPSSAPPIAAPATLGLGHDARITFYDASYHGYDVRAALLERPVKDAYGHPWMLRVQAAESIDRRSGTRAGLLRREVVQDTRMLLATVLVVWVGIAWTLRPLKRLRASLRASGPGELQPLPAEGVPLEVRPLVESLNDHIEDHRAVLDEQARFLADASHQLRTPLAIMMTQAGYALREHDPQVQRETLQAIMAQLARSRRLSDQLLAMAHARRSEADSTPPPLVDFNAIAREVVLQHLPLAREKKQDLGWSGASGEDSSDGERPTLPVRAVATELHEALANLLHNALRHTPAGGSITVATRAEDGNAIAVVCDEGPGIPPERREEVFQRFRRGSGGGAGLGLAIARAYARRNGGEIVLSDARSPTAGSPGLCAALVLPLATDEG